MFAYFIFIQIKLCSAGRIIENEKVEMKRKEKKKGSHSLLSD